MLMEDNTRYAYVVLLILVVSKQTLLDNGASLETFCHATRHTERKFYANFGIGFLFIQ